jgi:phage I-like protein
MRKHHAKPRLVRLSAGTDPPSEFRLFPLGAVETTKGTFLLEPEDAKACLADWKAYGNDLSIDYGHGVFREDEGEPQRAAGWIGGLELRADGLWAVRVSWTPTAAEMLRNREQRYFSPAFETDDEGHITRLLNVALTLMPATHRLTPLVASRRSGRTTVSTRKHTTMADKYCKASDLEKMADELEKKEGASEADKDMAARLRKLAEDAQEMSEGGEPEATSDDPEEGADPKKDEEKQASARLARLAREVTGETDPSRVEGVLRALKGDAGTVATLSKRVAELEGAQTRGRVESFVKLHATPGPSCKLTPAEVPDMIAWGLKDEKAMTAYVEKKSVIVAASTVHAAGNAGSGQGAASITDEERKVIKLSGLSEDEWLKAKSKNA